MLLYQVDTSILIFICKVPTSKPKKLVILLAFSPTSFSAPEDVPAHLTLLYTPSIKTLDHKENMHFIFEPVSTLDIFMPLYKGSS